MLTFHWGVKFPNWSKMLLNLVRRSVSASLRWSCCCLTRQLNAFTFMERRHVVSWLVDLWVSFSLVSLLQRTWRMQHSVEIIRKKKVFFLFGLCALLHFWLLINSWFSFTITLVTTNFKALQRKLHWSPEMYLFKSYLLTHSWWFLGSMQEESSWKLIIIIFSSELLRDCIDVTFSWILSPEGS